MHTSFAQSKDKKLRKAVKKEKKGKEDDKEKKERKGNAPSVDTVTASTHKPIDTVIIIDPKTGKAIDARKSPPVKAFRKPDTIIYIDNNKPKEAQPAQGITHKIDTVIVIKNGRQKKGPGTAKRYRKGRGSHCIAAVQLRCHEAKGARHIGLRRLRELQFHF